MTNPRTNQKARSAWMTRMLQRLIVGFTEEVAQPGTSVRSSEATAIGQDAQSVEECDHADFRVILY